MRRLVLGFALVLLGATACDDESGNESGADGGSPSSCPPGLTGLGAACVPALESCPADSVPVAGGGCQQVGVAACPGGLATPGGACAPVGSRAACPAGWTRGTGGWCEPRLPSAACPQGARTVVGQATCRPVGECGSGTYGEIKATAKTVFVDGSHAGGSSDGTQAKPYTSIGAALAAAPSGAEIAVAAGEYAEDVTLTGPTTLVGRCAGMVTIKGASTAAKSSALRIVGSGAAVRGVTVTGPSTGVHLVGSAALERVVVTGCGLYGILALASSTLTVTDSLVAGNSSAGVSLEESSGTLDGVEVRDTLADSSGQRGFGVEATFMTGRELVVRDSVIARSRRSGVFVHGGKATLENSVIRDTQPEPKSKMYGYGVRAIQENKGTAPSLVMKDCLVAGNRTVGVVAAGAAATLEGVVVRDTGPRELDGDLGTGVLAQPDQTLLGPAKLELRACLIAGNRNSGVAVEGSEALIEGTGIRETREPPANPASGYGVQVGGGTLTMTDCLVEKNRGVGVLVVDSGAVLSRVMVRETDPRGSDGQLGVGVQAYRDTDVTELTLRDCTLTGNHQAALNLQGVKAELEGVVLTATLPTAGEKKGLFGAGLEAGLSSGQPSAVTMKRCAVSGNQSVGLSLFGSSATLTGCSIQDTRSQAVDRTLGMGIVAQRDGTPATLDITDSVVAGSRTAGVTVWESSATIRRCVVSATRRQEKEDRYFGDGIAVFGAQHPAELVLSNSLVERSARANLLFVDRAGGAVDGSAFTGGEYGVAFVGAAAPKMGDDNTFRDNQDNRPSHVGPWDPIPPLPLPSL